MLGSAFVRGHRIADVIQLEAEVADLYKERYHRCDRGLPFEVFEDVIVDRQSLIDLALLLVREGPLLEF